jgi:prephenate dehydrogenase
LPKTLFVIEEIPMNQTHIVGGGGGTGRWLAEQIFHNSEAIFCYDISSKSLESLPNFISPCPLTDSNFSTYAANFQSGDFVILAIPQTELQLTLENLLPVMPSDILFVASTSTQRESLQLLRQHVPSTCAYLGFHTLFSPQVSSQAGQSAALIDFDSSKQLHQQFRSVVERSELQISTLTVDEHDNYMANIQALTHFIAYSFEAMIAASNIPLSDLLKLKTPNFQFFHAISCRIIKLPILTTGSIQFTPEAKAVREAYISIISELSEQLSSSRTVIECASVLDQKRSPLSYADVDEGAETAAIAVNAWQSFEQILIRHKTSGELFFFRHRETKVLHIARITDVSHDSIKFIESTRRFFDKDGALAAVAVGLIEQAKTNYKRVGIFLPKITSIEVRKRNIKPLNPSEVEGFYKERIKSISVKLKFRNPRDVKEDYVEELMPLAITGLWKCEFLENHRNRGKCAQIFINATFDPSINIDEAIEQLRLAIEEGKLTTSARVSVTLQGSIPQLNRISDETTPLSETKGDRIPWAV